MSDQFSRLEQTMIGSAGQATRDISESMRREPQKLKSDILIALCALVTQHKVYTLEIRKNILNAATGRQLTIPIPAQIGDSKESIAQYLLAILYTWEGDLASLCRMNDLFRDINVSYPVPPEEAMQEILDSTMADGLSLLEQFGIDSNG